MIPAAGVHPGTAARAAGSAVPWLTVVSLAVLAAYADNFWIVSLRVSVGAIERTQAPFSSWLAESAVALPMFVLAVFAALMLARQWFGPAPSGRTVLVTGLLVAAAVTLIGAAELAASSATDYQLQLQLMDSGQHGAAQGLLPDQRQATL